jgi:hypothetical protein
VMVSFYAWTICGSKSIAFCSHWVECTYITISNSSNTWSYAKKIDIHLMILFWMCYKCITKSWELGGLKTSFWKVNDCIVRWNVLHQTLNQVLTNWCISILLLQVFK